MDTKTLRTAEEAGALADLLDEANKNTPAHDIWGGSNREAIAEILSWALALRWYAKTGELPEGGDLLVAKNWLKNRPSLLDDYQQ